MPNTELSFLTNIVFTNNDKTSFITDTELPTKIGRVITPDMNQENNIKNNTRGASTSANEGVTVKMSSSEFNQQTSNKNVGVTNDLYHYELFSDVTQPNNPATIQNYIKNESGAYYNKSNPKYKSTNPYMSLIQDFSESKVELDNNGNEIKKWVSPGKLLKYSDFVYLRDIGVYPINRLMILRRYIAAPSYDLSEEMNNKNQTIGVPISTVIGWVKADEDIFSMSFNEVWKSTNKFVHELIREIINDQFNLDIGNIIPIPGWGQSMVFGFLHKLGFTDYDGQNLPIGDPNLLREGVTRETESMGLASNINMTLETAYELKYVNDVDPTVAFHNIIQNLLNMGTSNVKFLFKGGGTMGALGEFINNPSLANLIVMMKKLINTIFTELKSAISSGLSKLKNKNGKVTEPSEETARDNDNKKKMAESTDFIEKGGKKYAVYKDANGDSQEEDVKSARYIQAVKEKNSTVGTNLVEAEKNKLKTTEKQNKYLNTASIMNAGASFIDFISGIVDDVLASTMARYKWPMQGAIAQSTGMNLTPWHLTVGNPASPILSMNQIKVDSVEVRLGSEMLFNDLPKYVYAKITISQARNLGKQELMRFFGVNLKRTYSNVYKTSTIEDQLNMKSILSDKKISERGTIRETPTTTDGDVKKT